MSTTLGNAASANASFLLVNAETGVNGGRNLTLGPALISTDSGQGSTFNLKLGATRNASTAGGAVTLAGEGAKSGGTNLAGGNLVLQGGLNTGAGAGGSVLVKVAPAGSTGTTDGTLATAFGVDSNGNVVVGNVGTPAALATSATNGFLYIPTTAGKPTGNAAAYAGLVAFCFDSTGSKLSVNTTGTTWVQTAALA